MNPKNYTIVNSIEIGKDYSRHRITKLYYRDYLKYDYLPTTVKSPETEKEYKLYWEWKKNNPSAEENEAD